MGLYDYINCKYPLPREGANALEYQTKDTPAQYLDRYEIREDGSLWHEAYDTEDRSDPSATGLYGLFGCAAKVNQRWERVFFTGEIVFYDFLDDDDATWVEWSAYYIDGSLQSMVYTGD